MTSVSCFFLVLLSLFLKKISSLNKGMRGACYTWCDVSASLSYHFSGSPNSASTLPSLPPYLSCARCGEVCDGCRVDAMAAVGISSFLLTFTCGPAVPMPDRSEVMQKSCVLGCLYTSLLPLHFSLISPTIYLV